jgi:hypothetical protein
VKRVQVYYNIRRGDYSVRQSGRVIDHVDTIILRDCRFNVAPAGRDKVRATGVKNVHATVSGYIDESVKISRVSLLYKCDDFLELIDNVGHLVTRIPIHPAPGLSQPVVYNPKRNDTFVKMYGSIPVHTAQYVALLPKRKIRAWGVK